MPNRDLYEAGLKVRREVVGSDLVDSMLASADDFTSPMQDFVTEYAWGAVWTRPGLDRRSRSILNIGMLVGADKPDALSGHIKGALANGVSKQEIQEMLLQSAIYLGFPAGLAAFKVAKQVFDDLESE